MQLTFHIAPKNSRLGSEGDPFNLILVEDNWDDFGFKTFFSLYLYNAEGKLHELGSLRIGMMGQSGGYTSTHMPKPFSVLTDNFFSLGNGVEYYLMLRDLPDGLGNKILAALRDLAYDKSIIPRVQTEKVFKDSLLRDTSLSTITTQFERVIAGGATLTAFNFSYSRQRTDIYSGIELNFKVDPESKPSSNIHILIGRNGVGKTTLLNDMVKAILCPDHTSNKIGFFKDNVPKLYSLEEHIIAAESGYFSGIVSVSFSAFDPFIPPAERTDRKTGIFYSYVGLKDQKEQSSRHKDTSELTNDFVLSLKTCLQVDFKRKLWEKSIRSLESDPNFAEMGLLDVCSLIDSTGNKFSGVEFARTLYKKMSSGHAIVILTITKLIEKVEEKTLILIDEPESHLHPPLLSAFMRSLSSLLESRNGIAIIATHSPVILQEVPRTCVSIMERYRLEMTVHSPEIETFAENVGILTREVFGLEVIRSGFHAMLAADVSAGKSYDQILHEYNGNVGLEGKMILQSLLNLRAETHK